MNHRASTNTAYVTGCAAAQTPRIFSLDAHPLSTAIAQLHERVERLLLRHAELQRTNVLLAERVQTLEAEHAQLRQRLNDAAQRIDHLLLRLEQTHSIPGTPDSSA